MTISIARSGLHNERILASVCNLPRKSRFHGDETRVAATQNITPLCVDDRVEIAVNLFNAKGMVDIPNIKWRPLRRDAIGVRECYIEEDLMDWYDLDSFQAQSVEKLQIPDFFAPQMTHGPRPVLQPAVRRVCLT